MKITHAGLRVLRAPVDDGIAMSFAPLRHRSMMLVELHADDGTVGYGESWVNYPSWAPAERVATLREGVFPLVVGEEIDDIVALQRKLLDRLGPIGRQWGAPGPVSQAISAVDMALWDLCGRAAGRAVSRLAGGRTRDTVAVYASSLGPADVAEQAAACARAGHRAVKVKLGFGRETDERILSEARTTLGENVTLYADANQAWTVPEAIEMAPVLTAYDVAWIEEPIAGDDLADLEELHRRTGLRIATGENIYGRQRFRPYVASPAIAVVQPDVAKTGGITEVLAICAAAAEAGTAVFPHLYGGAVAFAATLQLAACQPAIVAVEYDVRANPLRDPLLVDPPLAVDGRIALPDLPGLAMTLDPVALDRCSVAG